MRCCILRRGIVVNVCVYICVRIRMEVSYRMKFAQWKCTDGMEIVNTEVTMDDTSGL